MWCCYDMTCSVMQCILCLNVTRYVLRYVLPCDAHTITSTTINAVLKVKTHHNASISCPIPQIVCPCMVHTVYVCACPQCRNVIEPGVVEGWFV